MMERMEFDEKVEDTVMPLMATIENLESDSNPYGLPSHERGDWAADLDVKVAEPAETSTSQVVQHHLTSAIKR